MYAIGKLQPFRTPRHRRSGIAAALALVGYLLAAPALAQVAGLCGPGKVCSARAFKATGTTEALQCLTNGNSTAQAYGWARAAQQLRLVIYDNQCSTALGNVLVMDPSVSELVVSNWSVTSALGYSAPRAFASFPTAASATGRLLYDSTNNRWRQSRLSAWVPFLDAASESQSIHVPLNAALNNPLNQWVWTYGNVGLEQNTSIFIDAAVVLTAGVGAGNAVYTVYDATGAAATSATVTVACTAAAGTVTTGTSDNTLRALPRKLQLRLTTNGCSTLPVLNVQVRTSAL